MKTTNQTGATPRKLNERELHRELRRADLIISSAMQYIPDADISDLDDALVGRGLTSADDFAAYSARQDALNRITPKRDYLKIMLIVLCILLGWAWYTAQLDRDLFMAQIAQGEHRHGDSN